MLCTAKDMLIQQIGVLRPEVSSQLLSIMFFTLNFLDKPYGYPPFSFMVLWDTPF